MLLMSCQSVKTFDPHIIIPEVEELTERPDITVDDSNTDYVIISNYDYYALVDYIRAVQLDYRVLVAKIEYMIEQVNSLTDDK